MGLLDDVLKDDAAFAADTDVFGESIVYTPKGGSAKTITALAVFRNEPRFIDETNRGLAPDLEIVIRNHATAGVTSVNTGGDRVTIARRIGETAASLHVYEIVSQDAAAWRLRLR